MATPVYSDNTLVKRTKSTSGGQTYWSCEYIQVVFREPKDDEPEAPYIVSLDRYCVPGRCSTYMFDYCPGYSGYGDRVRYFSEGATPIVKSLAMLAKDIDKPSVIEMLVKACERHPRYGVTLCEHLVSSLAPKSKAYKALTRWLTKWRKDFDKRVAARKAARLAEESLIEHLEEGEET